MNAMEMMMKQLGIDPAALKENAEKIGVLVAQVAETLSRIETQNERIEKKLDTLLADNGTPAAQAVPVLTQQHEA